MDLLIHTTHLTITLAIVISTLGFHSAIAEGIRCGRPGRPVNGTISPSGKSYFPGEKVTYSCLEGFVLFGEDGRTCLKNGTWSGEVPLCDFNLARGKRSLQSSTLWSYSPDLAVDGNVDTCSFTPRGPEPRWWQVHLGHKFNVVAIGVTISPGSFQEFSIFVIELLADNKAHYKPCTTFKGVFQTHKALFKCNDGLGHPGQFVYLRDERKEEEYFGLCEVEVFAFRERIPCGEPEIPVEGQINRESEEKVIYSCNTGFKLEGDSALTCSSKGKWQGHTPHCTQMKCPSPPTLANGDIDFTNPRGDYVFGTEIHYSCNPGFHMRGTPVLTCNEKSDWSGELPECQTITCGNPPIFPNSRHTILNDPGHWNKIAVYTCDDGYTQLVDNENTVTSCLGNGTWRFINVTCIPSDSTNLLSREGQGRALSNEFISNSSSMSQLIIALAITAVILVIIMIIVGILFVRRRYLAGPGSLTPLMRSLQKDKSKFNNGNGFHRQRAASKDNSAIPNRIDGLGRPAHFQANFVHGVPYVGEQGDCGFYYDNNGYEKSKPCSEHSYETLRKKIVKEPKKDTDDIEDENYEQVNGNFNNSKQLKRVGKTDPESGYEPVRNEFGYETVKDKEPGYETVKEGDHDPGYEVVQEETKSVHGYETLKPKLPPREQLATEVVPDILQNLQTDQEDVQLDRIPSEDIPPEILALYAKVDKSKKSKYKTEPLSFQPPAMLSGGSATFQGIQNKFSKFPIGTKDIINKFNTTTAAIENGRQNSLDSSTGHRSLSPQTSITSDGSVSSTILRPLPPIPNL